ncbi:hypothetical protein RUM44_013543 [Polyplax serrata]|uniref:PDZ and LIM domain protein Zasp n=1 Tax=Polyplax serrata TaxID=468196 RepID=A0ABR1BIQ3_POLSC
MFVGITYNSKYSDCLIGRQIMAQLISVNLSRYDASPWGFRLQGGKDFGQPLIIQKVNSNSIAEKAGLQPGDALIRINNVELFDLAHKDAQNAIVRAGNNFELTIQRGGSTWKPSVIPVGPTPTPNPSHSGYVQPVTKTSLAHKPQAPMPSFSQYNYAPKPFGGAQVNGMSGDKNQNYKNMASKMYNSPIRLYSDQTIAETLSAQAEVLAGGAVGVNFMKNEKAYNAANSEVLKMVQEIDSEPREPEPAEIAPTTPTTPKPSNSISGLRHVSAPETKPQPAQDQKVLPPGQNICADCERLIVESKLWSPEKQCHLFLGGFLGDTENVGGRFLFALLPSATPCTNIMHECNRSDGSLAKPTLATLFTDSHLTTNRGLFVRIKDKNLHVECFKCATCGTSLKNIGYYNINNKLYCDIHAKMVARQNPPSANLEPLIVPPGSKLPASVISSCIGSVPPSFQAQYPTSTTGPGSPQPGTTAPLPFHVRVCWVKQTAKKIPRNLKDGFSGVVHNYIFIRFIFKTVAHVYTAA